ncbi:MAG: iron ABC transporter permease [Eubacterium sp.]|nr:iron ABC transporter permease [Eubacterium sp.]
MNETNKKERNRSVSIILLLCAAWLVVFFVSFALGRYAVPVPQVIQILFHEMIELIAKVPFLGWLDDLICIPVTWTAKMESVVIMIRLPRILMACLVGGCLAAAGAAYQGVFQNPMASPDILGASNGAAFGAALAILLGSSLSVVTGTAFVMSMLTILIVFLVAHFAPGQKIVNLILAGIMTSSLFSAGTSYIKLVADPDDQLPAITYWMMGSLSGAELSDVAFVIVPMAIGLIPLLLLRWQINLLTLGDEEARALGVNTNVIRLVVIACATLVTAASVSVSGMIGWVGLVIPHLCRKMVGSNYRYLMPASVVCGAVFLLLVDNVSRNLLAVEIPIGILTAFVGAPFFIYLILHKEKYE